MEVVNVLQSQEGVWPVLKRFLEVPVVDLQRIRVRCKREACGGVLELSVDKLDVAFPSLRCPLCGAGHTRDPKNTQDAFHQLARSLRAVRSLEREYDVDFVLAEPSGQDSGVAR